MSFDVAFKKILEHEGTIFTDRANDAGGPTKFGITLKTYQGVVPTATSFTIEHLTQDQAYVFYKNQFWYAMKLDSVNDAKLAVVIFDLGVNTGVVHAANLLQQVCNCVPDGIIGPATINAVNTRSGPTVCLQLVHLQSQAYVKLAIKRPSDLVNLNGWNNRIFDLLNFYFIVG